jgi:hypothetical protein
MSGTQTNGLSALTLRRLARHLAATRAGLSDGAARRVQDRLAALSRDVDAALDAAARTRFEALLSGRKPGPPPERDPAWPALRAALVLSGLRLFVAERVTDARLRALALGRLPGWVATLGAARAEAVLDAAVRLALDRDPAAARAILDDILHELTRESPMEEFKFYIDTNAIPQLRGEAGLRYLEAVHKALVQRFGMSEEEANLEKSPKAAAILGMVLLDEEYDFRSLSFMESLKRAWTESLQETRRHPPNGVTTVPNREVYIFVARTIPQLNGGNRDVSYQQLAFVARHAIANADAIPFEHPNFISSVRIGLDRFVVGKPAGDSLSVPNGLLTGGGDGGRDTEELNGPNIEAVGMMYAVALYEQAYLFRALDRIAEMFRFSWIAVGNDPAGKALDDYIWDAEDRISEAARMSEYGRVLGMPGGEVPKEVQPNLESEQIFMRFISTAAEYDRQRRVTDILDPRRRSLASTGEQVRKARRDLAANTSLYG